MEHSTLLARDILPAGAAAHVTRATLTAKRPRRLHQHDFHELLWVQNGLVRHHLPDRCETLREGDLILISPGQAHGLQGQGEAAMIATVCVDAGCVGSLVDQHPTLHGIFDPDRPGRFHRDIKELAILNQSALQLERGARDALAAAAFLLPLLSQLATAASHVPPDAPKWLREACTAAQDIAVFREGAAGFAALTGKAHPHVSRTTRRWLGQTPSDYINAIRMAHAARALVTDTDPLADIATEIGIPNLSHFHKLFRARYGMTPLQYRQKYQRDVLQPN